MKRPKCKAGSAHYCPRNAGLSTEITAAGARQQQAALSHGLCGFELVSFQKTTYAAKRLPRALIHMWTAAACEGVEFSFGEMVRCSHMSGPLVRCI